MNFQHKELGKIISFYNPKSFEMYSAETFILEYNTNHWNILHNIPNLFVHDMKRSHHNTKTQPESCLN